MNDGLLAVGASFRGYVVLRKIGAGGTGEVYLARHETLTVDFAVKVIARDVIESDREMRQRFFREVKTAARIRHPTLVAVHDAGFDEMTGLYFVVMDYLPGGTVADELRRANRLSLRRALRIARTVADGLRALERNGVVHRDVKPSNMLLADDGSVKLSDMGIVRETAQGARTITQTGFALGTPAYMSYEQIVDSHAVDARTDIYALGVSLYEMLTGVLPDGELSSVQLLKKRVDGARIPDIRTVNSAIPDELAEMISKMTEPDVVARWRSLDELIATLDARLAELGPKKNVFVPRKNRRGRSSTEARCLVAGILLGGLSLAVASLLLGEKGFWRRPGGVEEDRPSARPEEAIAPLTPPSEPNARAREVVREVVREVTNEVVRVVTVTNVVTQGAAPPAAAVPKSGKLPVARPKTFAVPTRTTNLVEGVEIRGTTDRMREIRSLSRMMAVVADEVRHSYGLPHGHRVQSRVKAVELTAGGGRYAFDATTGVVHVGAEYGGFPCDGRKMADLCVGFMAVCGEGVSDRYNDQAVALVKARARQKAIGSALLPGVRDRSVTMMLLVKESSCHADFLPSYFRIRREAYAKGRIVGPMSVHDFAAIVSLAAGENVFPYLRRRGVKVDEFASNVKARGLPQAVFFDE